MPSRDPKAVTAAADVISANCLAARVRLLHRTLIGIFDEALRPLGLTDAQLTILVVVAKLGPLSPGNIARRLNMEKSTISRNVARMDKNGWLSISPTGSGREQQLALSASGQALLVKALPLWREAQSQATTVLGKRGADSIRTLGNNLRN